MNLFSAITELFASNPSLVLVQGSVALLSFILIFLLIYTLRDILLRTHSLAYQCACILLVAALPIIGFLLYLLVRPARTLKERETERMLKSLLGEDMQEPAPIENDSSTPTL